MKISLVITGDKKHYEMNRFFDSILNQKIVEYDCIEIIFINQGEYKPPKAIYQKENISFIEIKSKKIGLSIARNLGLKEITGEIIAFPDDDCWYHENLLNDICNILNRDKFLSGISTNVYDPNTKKTYGNKPFIDNIEINYLNLFKLPTSVGLFIKTQTLLEVGKYFDENLGAGTTLGSGEEIELVHRIISKNYKLKYFGNTMVYHPVLPYEDSDIIKYYKYGLGFGFLNAKIIKSFKFQVIFQFLKVITRSFLGFIWYIKSKKERNIYINRLKGILKGFILGIKTR